MKKKILLKPDRFNEYIMTRLRTIWGIDMKFVETTFGKNIPDEMTAGAKALILNAGYMQQNEENVTLTQKGKFLADKIASDLFI